MGTGEETRRPVQDLKQTGWNGDTFFLPLVGHRVLARATCSMLPCRAASNGSFTTRPHCLSRWILQCSKLCMLQLHGSLTARNKPALLQCIAFAHAVMSFFSSIARKTLTHPSEFKLNVTSPVVTLSLLSRLSHISPVLPWNLAHTCITAVIALNSNCVFVFVVATTKMVTSHMAGID